MLWQGAALHCLNAIFHAAHLLHKSKAHVFKCSAAAHAWSTNTDFDSAFLCVKTHLVLQLPRVEKSECNWAWVMYSQRDTDKAVTLFSSSMRHRNMHDFLAAVNTGSTAKTKILEGCFNLKWGRSMTWWTLAYKIYRIGWNYEELPVSMAEVHNRENKANFMPKLSKLLDCRRRRSQVSCNSQKKSLQHK